MLTKTEITIFVFSALAFMAGVAVARLCERMKRDSVGLWKGLRSEIAWAGEKLAAPFKPALGWLVRTLDQYAPIFKTRTHTALAVQKVAGFIGVIFPALHIAPQSVEVAVSVICLIAFVWGYFRGLYARRHAGWSDERPNEPRPYQSEAI